MERRYLVIDVLEAMKKHELKVYYQPKYDATTNRLKSAEALVRWVQNDGNVILPEFFLPQLELSDAITILDWYVVEEVCSFLERMNAEGIKLRPVSVNFSRWHLHEVNAAQHHLIIVVADVYVFIVYKHVIQSYE